MAASPCVISHYPGYAAVNNNENCNADVVTSKIGVSNKINDTN